MIKLCALLDKMGYYKSADLIQQKYVEAQFIQPSNNANWPIETRMVPWKEIEDTFKQRDRDWFTKSPPLRPQEYMQLPGMSEPPAYPSEQGTSNLQPQNTKEMNEKALNQLINIYHTYPLNKGQKNNILKQIQRILAKVQDAGAVSGNAFDMQGPDAVPGPRNAVMDHASPSMVGLDGFTWKNKRDVYDNPDDSYKKLLLI